MKNKSLLLLFLTVVISGCAGVAVTPPEKNIISKSEIRSSKIIAEYLKSKGTYEDPIVKTKEPAKTTKAKKEDYLSLVSKRDFSFLSNPDLTSIDILKIESQLIRTSKISMRVYSEEFSEAVFKREAVSKKIDAMSICDDLKHPTVRKINNIIKVLENEN